MSKCAKCGSDNPDNSVFCLECGAPLVEVREYAVFRPGHPVRLTPTDFGGSFSSDEEEKPVRRSSGKGLIAAAAAAGVLLAAGGGIWMIKEASAPYQPSTDITEGEDDREAITDAVVNGLADCIYTGEEVFPQIEVSLGGRTLREGTDYQVIGVDDVLPGQAHLMIFGRGDYEGEVYCDYYIKLDDPVCDDPLNENMIEFVNRFYRTVYFRNGSRDEIVSWVGRLHDRTADGTDIAVEFFTSAEMEAQQLSDEEFVCDLYRVLLGRKAEPEGLAAWCTVLSDGTPRGDVVAMLASSNEFGNLCSMYGIEASI